MRVAFVDTLYFVALFNPKDQWHGRAIAASQRVAETKLITTEDVLVELTNQYRLPFSFKSIGLEQISPPRVTVIAPFRMRRCVCSLVCRR